MDELTALTGHQVLLEGWATKKEDAASTSKAPPTKPSTSSVEDPVIETAADQHSLLYQANKMGLQEGTVITIKGKAELFRIKLVYNRFQDAIHTCTYIHKG